MAAQARSVLITGARGGLGSATARTFAERGWRVIAADLAPPVEANNIVPMRLDVTQNQSVVDVMDQVDGLCPGGLGCVVNFAGILVIGALVELPEEQLRRVLDINVLGTFRVNQAAFPLLRRGGGRIVNISSETGWQRALMMNGPYAMSKHAIEAYTDALRRELMFVGVPVIAVQPGPFRTAMTASIDDQFRAAVRPGSPFARMAGRVGALAAGENGKARDPAEVAEAVWTAATTARPKLRYSVRPDLQRRVMNRLPARLVDRILLQVLRRR